MKKKIFSILLAAALLLCALASCGKKDIDYDYTFADKTYYYEKEGIGGVFSITINSDGSFTYTEGPESNYEAHGAWTYVDGTLILLDDLHGSDRTIQNNFFFVDGNLWYLAESSTGFPLVTVEEGDLFLYAYSNTAETEG